MKDLIIKEMYQSGKQSFTADEIIQMIDKFENREVVECSGITADMKNRTIIYNDKTLNLPKKVFLLVHYFIKNNNKVINRNKLLNDIWGTDVIVCDRTIDVHIRKIRKLMPNIKLKTIKGVGYMLKD